MTVRIEKLSEPDLRRKRVFDWPVWEKGQSEFDWEYDETEQCYFLEGKVVMKTPKGRTFEFGKGDFVTFPRGMRCTWMVREPVRKHYTFR